MLEVFFLVFENNFNEINKAIKISQLNIAVFIKSVDSRHVVKLCSKCLEIFFNIPGNVEKGRAGILTD